jgi:hypothetical protein
MVANAMPDYVDITEGQYRTSNISPTDSTASVSFQSGGTQTGVGTSAKPADAPWLKIGTNSDYEIFVTNNGPAALTSGTTGSWLGLGTTRTWTVTETGIGDKLCSLDVQIRKISLGNLVVATGTISIRAVVDI